MKPISASYSVQELAELSGSRVIGDPKITITGLCSVHRPQPFHLAFLRLGSRSAALKLLTPLPAMAVLIDKKALPTTAECQQLHCSLIPVDNPQAVFVEIISKFFEPEKVQLYAHQSAIIDPTATIGFDVSIGANCVVGAGVTIGDGAILHSGVTLYRDVQIGAKTELHSGVVIREGCRVGSNCIIHNNTVIGADGFGYLSDTQRGLVKVPQVGVVAIDDYVEIGAGTAIDRATVGATVIGAHTKIDNHVQIGHNVVIGSHCLLCAQVGVAGSATIGNGVVLGGGTGVADHVTIVSGVRVGGHSGVTSSLEEPGDYMGMPIMKASAYRRQQGLLKRLSKPKDATQDKSSNQA
jgi:UDP-3-O-[3-hydroxymyristoyl] glucosamine N-acyltransferase